MLMVEAVGKWELFRRYGLGSGLLRLRVECTTSGIVSLCSGQAELRTTQSPDGSLQR